MLTVTPALHAVLPMLHALAPLLFMARCSAQANSLAVTS
jgi:hypothetical protein